jgi:hypothetical protein
VLCVSGYPVIQEITHLETRPNNTWKTRSPGGSSICADRAGRKSTIWCGLQTVSTSSLGQWTTLPVYTIHAMVLHTLSVADTRAMHSKHRRTQPLCPRGSVGPPGRVYSYAKQRPLCSYLGTQTSRWTVCSITIQSVNKNRITAKKNLWQSCSYGYGNLVRTNTIKSRI